MNKELEKLKQIKASIEKLDKEYRAIKGYGECSNAPCPAEVQDMMYQICRNIYSYIDNSISYIYRWQDEHQRGHLPPINGPEKLQNAIDVLGLDGDYEVNKRQLWAGARYVIGSNGVIELQIDKKN